MSETATRVYVARHPGWTTSTVVFRRWVTRHALARELGIGVGDVQIDRTCLRCGHPTHGRPRLVTEHEASLWFSTASTGGLVAVAIARHGIVGVDIEHVRPVSAEMIDMACSERERSRLSACSRAERDREFVKLWVRKEAVLKAHGTGLVMRAGSGPAAPMVRPLRDVLQDPKLHVTDLRVPDGVVAAVATERASVTTVVAATVIDVTDGGSGSRPMLAVPIEDEARERTAP
jgi:hypothetical protein